MINNWLLDQRQITISGWFANGSLWTLLYEFLCYLLILGVAVVGLLRRRVAVLVLAGGLWLVQMTITFVPGQRSVFNVYRNWMLMNFIKFAAVFLVGSALYLWKEVVPDSGWIALACGAVFLASLFLPGANPAFSFAAACLGAPLIVLPLLWLGAHLPFQRVGARNDYSYGVYIYAFPVTILLAAYHVARLGPLLFLLASTLCTLLLAVPSWWLVERRAMALRKVEVSALFGRSIKGPGGLPSATDAPRSESAPPVRSVGDAIEASD